MPDQLPSRKPDQSPDEIIVIRRSDWEELLRELKSSIKEAMREARQEEGFSLPKKWLTPEETMKILNISSKTTLQKYRDAGEITYSQREGKNIMYDAESINAYIDKHVKNTF